MAFPSALLEYLSRMLGSLERAWSDVLSTELAAKAREEAAGVWRSFVAAVVPLNDRMVRAARELGSEKTSYMTKVSLDAFHGVAPLR